MATERNEERKCDSCKFCMSNYKGTYCGCPKNSEYGLYSIYGWCEYYERDALYGGIDTTSLRKEFYINDMSITFGEAMTQKQATELFRQALSGIGVINQKGCPV